MESMQNGYWVQDQILIANYQDIAVGEISVYTNITHEVAIGIP